MSPGTAGPVEDPDVVVGAPKTDIHKYQTSLRRNSVLTGRGCGLGSAIGWSGIPEKAPTEDI